MGGGAGARGGRVGPVRARVGEVGMMLRDFQGKNRDTEVRLTCVGRA